MALRMSVRTYKNETLWIYGKKLKRVLIVGFVVASAVAWIINDMPFIFLSRAAEAFIMFGGGVLMFDIADACGFAPVALVAGTKR